MQHTNNSIVPVILCGGQGSRLWPLSRKNYPKQFIELMSGGSLLQETVKRIYQLPQLTAPIIICNEMHYFLTHEQLQHINVQPACMILEPMGKSTAPAITLAALQAIDQFGENPLLLIMPADHFIQDVSHFQQAVIQASQQAQHYLITFGIQPTAPKTGYGYIKLGAHLSESLYKVTQFAEKPNLATAQQYCASKEYLWNSGMFLFRAKTFLEEVEKLAQPIYATCQQTFTTAIHDQHYLRLIPESFMLCPEDSIDYAIMEKTHRAAVLPMNCGWADMGDWATIAEIHEQNDQGNVIKGDVVIEDVRSCCLYASNRLIAAVGVENLVVIETQDAVLIADKERTQDVKRIVAQLQQHSHQAASEHRRVYHPWGHSELLTASEHYQVRYLMLKPQAQLATQSHHSRAEHWVVVSGTAQVEYNQHRFILKNNESTHLPRNYPYRLTNTGVEPLYIIEVQTGHYLSQQDIIRISETQSSTTHAEESLELNVL